MERWPPSLLLCALTTASVASFGLLLPPSPRCSPFHPAAAISAPDADAPRLPTADRHCRTATLGGTAAALAAEATPPRRRRLVRLSLSTASSTPESAGEDQGKAFSSPNPQEGVDDAEARAETALRKLSPSELSGMKARLGLDLSLEGGEDIIAQAVPVLADKIRAKAAAQESERSAAVPAQHQPAPQQDPTKRSTSSSTVPLSPAEQASAGGSPRGDWAGGAEGDGVEKGWVGEKGSRRWVGAPGEKPPRQRHAKRQPDPPLAPGERSYFATCPRGLETVLRDELMSPLVGATLVKSSGRGCHFRGDQAVGYKAILWLRTAHRVLELVGEGGSPLGAPIDGGEALYGAAAAVPWSRYMEQGQTLCVDAILGVVPDGLTHSHFTALTVKNAVVDQLRDDGKRPSVDTENADLPLVVYLDRGRALLYRSLSGTRSMHKRGYRDAMHAASLKENVAAGLLLASGWDPETQALADPMCGSGTLVIEAALIALRRAPGLVAMGAYGGGGRAKVAGWKPAVTAWPDFDPVLWRETVGEALQLQRAKPPAAIMGNDWHHGALSLAWRDAKAAGVEDCITLFDEDVGRWRPPASVGLAVTNPPWDYRLDQGAEKSWLGLLEFLRREVAEKDAWVLSGNPALSRTLRMKSEQNMFLSTGGVELRWLKYHLNEYRGDRGKRGGGRGGPRPKKVPRKHDRPAIDRW
ncbi:conserved unknown protein [Ectocarpus siliculosus]|uniref:THUMP domain-containing protein n=1 Tax=Ectocarpus siliculosus TaxID=2880 RepID=D7FT13_ECTSI|nr:conserved unknown protein [Ectocarpus siliculosus]|eukprot:CBJ31304.1 conserved unknown protein [Ectocarpus siliculosus]